MHTPQDRAADLSVRRRARRQFAALNDGLVSTAYLMLGVGAAQVSPGSILLTGVAGPVARQLMAHDALGAHARDELGICQALAARPLQAALASAASFAAGAAVPRAVALAVPGPGLAAWMSATSLAVLAVLALLGAVAARAGGASMASGALRVTLWGALALGITAAAGHLFGTVG